MKTVRNTMNAGRADSDDAELAAMLHEYRLHYEPVGPLEESLVERLATYAWRLTQGIAAEVDKLQKQLEIGGRDSHAGPGMAQARAFNHYRRLLERVQSARAGKPGRSAPERVKITHPGNTLIN